MTRQEGDDQRLKTPTNELTSVLDDVENASDMNSIMITTKPSKHNSGVKKQASVILEEEEVALMESNQFSKGEWRFFVKNLFGKILMSLDI